jgi:DNA-binding Lrp family transcriptional regulator
MVQISRGGGDVLDPLLFTAILEANLAPINSDLTLQLAYATLESSPGDDLRRPVSIHAVAESLGLPFETVRRRVGGLARIGACVVTSRGVYVPHSAVTSPAYNAIQIARYERLREFYLELRDAGVLASAIAAPAADGPRVRAANRVISEYMLRVIDTLMGFGGGAIDTLLFLEMARANREVFETTGLAAPTPEAGRQRRPVRATYLAARLGLAAETTRRHLIILEAAGYCRRTPKGFLAALPSEATAVGLRIEENVANVQRMFARLAQLGVLGAWESDAAAVQTPSGNG